MSKTAEIKAQHQKYVMPTYAPGLALVKGDGVKVWDAEGTEYMDFMAGIAVLNCGHCAPRVTKAIQDQAAKLVHVSNLYFNELQPKLAEAISKRSLGGKVFFCNSGAEANEALIKLARLWGHASGRYEVISMRQSFHGRTLATLTATGQTKVQKGFDPLPEGFVLADFNRLESVAAAITDKTAAVLVEAIQGEGGVLPADPDFMTGLRLLCDEQGILLLVDEVQAGMGRTGNWFGYQAYNIEPDAISMAKALGNGFPIGAICTSPELADVFQPGHHATTFGGTPLACAAALAVIETIEEEQLMENAVQRGEQFTDLLRPLVDRYDWITDVRGRGLMMGLVCSVPTAPLQAELQRRGVLSLATALTVIRFLPPLIVSAEQISDVAQHVIEACAALDQDMSKGE